MFVKLERWVFNMPEVNDRRIIVQTNQFDEASQKLQAREIDEDSDKDSREDPLDITGYYILDLQTGGVSTLPRTVQDFGEMSSMVAVGSRIYLVGRPIRDSDSSEPSSCYFSDLDLMLWKRADPLITNRLPPLGGGVAFHGKMYFFTYSDDFSSFCQLFVIDPTQPDPHWHCIESTPGGDDDQLVLNPPVLADYKNNRIIVCLYSISRKILLLYAYYPSEDRWEFVVEWFPGNWFSCLGAVTIADGVIYAHYPKLKGFFQAYDIASKEWLEVKLSPAVKYSGSYYLPLTHHYHSLLHLGNGILCLLASGYQDPGADQIPTTTHIHVVQFQVELLDIHDKREVLVTPLSTRIFDLNSLCTAYRCLAL